MRTTLDLPEQLIAEALHLSRCKSKTEVIKTALKDLIQKEQIKGLKRYRGRIKLDIDLDAVRQR
ncbi:MAG: type II toxin-antitoxin system VapB family antitoxin [Planctomycetota bacterium]